MKAWMVNRLVDGEYRWVPLSQEVVDQIRKEAVMKVRKGTVVDFRSNHETKFAEFVVDEMIAGEVKRVAIDCDIHTLIKKEGGAAMTLVVEEREFRGREVLFTVNSAGRLDSVYSVDNAPPEWIRIYEEAIP